MLQGANGILLLHLIGVRHVELTMSLQSQKQIKCFRKDEKRNRTLNFWLNSAMNRNLMG